MPHKGDLILEIWVSSLKKVAEEDDFDLEAALALELEAPEDDAIFGGGDLFGDGDAIFAPEGGEAAGQAASSSNVPGNLFEQPDPGASRPEVVAPLGRGESQRHIVGAAGSEVVVVTKWGKITFYPHDSRFEAVCRFHQEAGDSRRCRLTRLATKNRSRKAQGRPLGLMLAWLEDAECRPGSRSEHVLPMHVGTSYSYDKRRYYRNLLKNMDNGPLLLEKERPQGEDPDSEPEGCP